jgi:hypothetical protein
MPSKAVPDFVLAARGNHLDLDHEEMRQVTNGESGCWWKKDEPGYSRAK